MELQEEDNFWRKKPKDIQNSAESDNKKKFLDKSVWEVKQQIGLLVGLKSF